MVAAGFELPSTLEIEVEARRAIELFNAFLSHCLHSVIAPCVKFWYTNDERRRAEGWPVLVCTQAEGCSLRSNDVLLS